MGEHADARELASLYISKGVPIYPAPRGHAYHTLAWRMGLELSSLTTTIGGDDGRREADGQNTGDVNEVVERPPPSMDTFYSYRYLDGANGTNNNDEEQRNVDAVARRRPPNRRGRNRRRNRHSFLSSRDQVMSMTYVEEKSLFWKQKNGIEEDVSTRTVPITATATTPSSLSFAPPQDIPQQQQPLDTIAAPQAAPHVELEFAGTEIAAALPSSMLVSNSVPDLLSLSFLEEEASRENEVYSIFNHRNSLPPLLSPTSHQLKTTAMMTRDMVVAVPKMTMRVHRHLADQHFFGSPAVDDYKGAMTAGEIHRIHSIFNGFTLLSQLEFAFSHCDLRLQVP